MKAVILAAGMGTRLEEMTKSIPKVMIIIKGKPLLEWHIELLRKHGVKEIYINLYYIPNVIVSYFGDGKKWNVSIMYFYEKELYGTGGALVQMQKELNERFLLLYGDVFTNIDIKDMEDFHIKNNADITLAVHKTDHPEDSDLVRVNNNMELKEIFLKPHKKKYGHTHGLAAIYIIEPRTLHLLSAKIPFDFVEYFLAKALAKNLSLFCYNTQSYIKDIGTKERYAKIKKFLNNDNL